MCSWPEKCFNSAAYWHNDASSRWTSTLCKSYCIKCVWRNWWAQTGWSVIWWCSVVQRVSGFSKIWEIHLEHLQLSKHFCLNNWREKKGCGTVLWQGTLTPVVSLILHRAACNIWLMCTQTCSPQYSQLITSVNKSDFALFCFVWYLNMMAVKFFQ